MDAVAAAGVAAARGVAMPVTSPSSSSRKEWRVVPEQSGRNSSNEDLKRGKLGQSDERLIYEVQQGRDPADVDFCSITIDGGLDDDILQQKLQRVVKQREELQQMEIELRAQLIARTEILEIQSSFDAQIKKHANANVELQEQLNEREKKIHELERKMEEKERELHAIRLDNEAAWAKEDLLREQSKELQTYRRERDNSEAERAQHIKQIHDLQEHFQEKERQFMELQEQNRIAQETILFKDEQLREAQAWISRVQEMDALQSSTNHSLQAELRERTEQYNQLWLGCQRQFGEMERLHLHIQQLQLELAEARERSGTYSDGLGVAPTNSKDISHTQNNGGQLDVSGDGTPSGTSGGLPNASAEHVSSSVSGGNEVVKSNHVQVAPSSLFGMPSYLPPGQVTPLHPFVMHQHGVPHSVPSHIPQTHVSHFHSIPAPSSFQQWQNQQVTSEGPHMPTPNQYPLQTDPILLRSESNYNYETSGNGQVIHPEYSDVNISQGVELNSTVSSSKDEREAFESMDKTYLSGAQSEQTMQQISSQFHDSLRLDPLEHNNENKEENVNHLANHEAEAQDLLNRQPSLSANSSQLEVPNHAVNFSNSTVNASPAPVFSDSSSSGQRSHYVAGKPADTPLLDERSLLACIVRTIPPGSGSRIRISSTLPNRLAKMLAPFHWHDYKKKYGKLDEFLASHPELFLIDGDYIQLREGAQEIIAATAAVAKVAAAAAATSAHSSQLPSVALTPMAQSQRLKKALPIELSGNTNNSSHLLDMQNQHRNGVYLSGDVSNVKLLRKLKDHMELNGSESKPSQSVIQTVANGAGSNRNELGSTQSNVSGHGRTGPNFIGKQQGRTIGAPTSSRR